MDDLNQREPIENLIDDLINAARILGGLEHDPAPTPLDARAPVNAARDRLSAEITRLQGRGRVAGDGDSAEGSLHPCLLSRRQFVLVRQMAGLAVARRG